MDGVWIGTYTHDRGAGRGIYRAERRPDGTLGEPALAAEAVNPSYLVQHPRGDVLYAVQEGPAAAVLAFAVDGARLHPVGRVEVPAGACHLALGPGGRHVLVASYDAGTVCAVTLAPDGTPTGTANVLAGRGRGPREDRQEGPHAHAVVVAPDSTVLSTDLGADLVRALRVDDRTGALETVSETQLPAGSGPRHLVVHPSGHVFVLTELARTVVVLRPGRGWAELSVVGESPATAEPVSEDSTCAAVVTSSDGRFLHTSTRGADVVTTHEVRAGGARLRPVADTGSGGRSPRDVLADSELLHVAHELSSTLVSFRVDPATGVPRPVGTPVDVPSPVCVVRAPSTPR